MSVVAAALRELIALGVSGEALVAAVERIEQAATVERTSTIADAVALTVQSADAEMRDEDPAERKRRLAAARQARKRQRDESVTMRDSSVTERDNNADSVTSGRPLPPSPQTPQPPTPTRECVSSRTRKGADDFERFWAVYPQKVAKDAARKAFPRALGKASVETLISAVERQRTWDQWQRGFIPHASTWLNQGRWADEEPDPPKPEPRKASHERPHTDPKFDARQANLARALAGADSAAGRRWEP